MTSQGYALFDESGICHFHAKSGTRLANWVPDITVPVSFQAYYRTKM